jgi:hypothetical protein
VLGLSFSWGGDASFGVGACGLNIFLSKFEARNHPSFGVPSRCRKKSRACARLSECRPTCLSGLDVTCLLLAFVACGNLEGYLLAFLQRLESLHVDRREVGEKIFATVVGSNKAKTLRVIEPLYGTGCHVSFLTKIE